MEYINQIIVTANVTLLVLAIPVVKLLVSWQNLLDAKAYREEQAGDMNHTLAVMELVAHEVLLPHEASGLLVGSDGDDDE